ncbi:NUDIX hydrolase [Saccharibacillus kuerlensis]|uniref:Nudix hydrolase n=1 Tax=Saccharibacillus kuerlensis TaxID=459527 RepID=A0ABQ2L498_9BACL|nr:NUDIX domain-containing protein [Saccharibacillus kuerlensis]GGO02360.1 putative Nudix hydrolase [Saccharibacillus kuerlensis]
MSVTEILDVFNDKHEHTGTASRSEVHRQGLWHQVFHCWVVSGSREEGWKLLFQLRHPDKETFPDKLDTSSAGHLLAGEGPREGMRELEEELGLAVRYEDLVYCGLHQEEYRISENYMDREFTHVYLYRCEQPLEIYRVQHIEVSGLFRIDAEQFRELVSGDRDRIEAEGVTYDKHLQAVQERRVLTMNDFTDNTAEYYALLFDKLAEL